MKIYIKRHGPSGDGSEQVWEEIGNVREVSISMENKGQADLFALDDKTLRVSMSGQPVELRVSYPCGAGGALEEG